MRILISLLLFCIFLNSQIFFAIQSPFSTPKVSALLETNLQPTSIKICTTSACKEAASLILKDMDPKVSPCDDFYKFACGSFLKTTVVPEGATYVDKFSLASKKLEQELRSIVEEEINPKELKAFRLAKNYYKACMNTAGIEKQGLRTVLYELKAVGGWPVVEGKSWKEASFDWIQTAYKFRKFGYSTDYFFTVGIGGNLKDNTKLAIYVDETSLGLARQYLIQGFNNLFVKAYYKYSVDVAVLYGANRAIAEKDLKDTLEFEMKLANISLPNRERRDLSEFSTQWTVQELSRKYPNIPWIKLFNAVLAPILEIDNSELIRVDMPPFFQEFNKLINATPKRVLANYFFQRAVDENTVYLTNEIRSRKLKFFSEISGTVTQMTPRAAECFGMTMKSLGLSVNAQYVRKFVNKASKQSAVKLLTNILQQFKKSLTDVDWMVPKTQKIALEKAKALKSYIAYPEEFLDDKKLYEFYRELEITPDDYLTAAANMSNFLQDYSFSQLIKPVENSDWSSYSDAAIVNVAYNTEENSMEVPAGILQDNFFNKGYPQYLNYAAIGSIIAHQITNGFGLVGSQIDKEGNYIDWWSEETKTKYLAKADCIIQQYSNYTVREVGLELNGYNTQLENIAYNGGVKVSYLAYQEWAKKNSPEDKLPGLNYSRSQLFWINAAQTWCTVHKPEELKYIVTNDNQTPAEFRIRGAFSNRPEFSKDFNCPVGSTMNPAKKCEVW
ncbi:neprilysin-2-like [Belonocnema kinseyi]|uniref:neprilysin-2-like n=1 Tax=Belonocnema kinseyi TaxID=2817044 RepID=UPI00143D4AC5|nr:neprilysin-2-like [Belonocnema kinseyi]